MSAHNPHNIVLLSRMCRPRQRDGYEQSLAAYSVGDPVDVLQNNLWRVLAPDVADFVPFRASRTV